MYFAISIIALSIICFLSNLRMHRAPTLMHLTKMRAILLIQYQNFTHFRAASCGAWKCSALMIAVPYLATLIIWTALSIIWFALEQICFTIENMLFWFYNTTI